MTATARVISLELLRRWLDWGKYIFTAGDAQLWHELKIRKFSTQIIADNAHIRNTVMTHLRMTAIILMWLLCWHFLSIISFPVRHVAKATAVIYKLNHKSYDAWHLKDNGINYGHGHDQTYELHLTHLNRCTRDDTNGGNWSCRLTLMTPAVSQHHIHNTYHKTKNSCDAQLTQKYRFYAWTRLNNSIILQYRVIFFIKNILETIWQKIKHMNLDVMHEKTDYFCMWMCLSTAQMLHKRLT